MRPIRYLVLFAALLCLEGRALEAQEPSQADIGILRQSLDLVDRGQSFGARQLARASQNQLVRDLVLYFDLQRSDSSSDFRSIAELLARHPDWPRAGRVARKAEEGLAGGVRQEEIVAFFSRVPPQTGAGALAYIGALEARGDRLGAESAARAAWREAELTEADETALLHRYRHALRPEDHLARLLYLIGEEEEDAVQQGALVGPGYPELAAARLALKAGKSSAPALVGKVPGRLRGDSYLLTDLAGYYHRKGRRGELDALLIQLGPANAGLPEEIWWVRLNAARQNLKDGNPRQAYVLARDHGLFSGSGFAELEWLAGFIALERLHDPATAYRHFVRYYEGSAGSPISLGKAAYWAARAAEAMGRPRDAEQWLTAGAAEQTAFYGQLAAARLGLEPGFSLPRQPALQPAAYARYLQDDRAQALAALARADERWRTNLFYAGLREAAKAQQDYLALARLAQSVGRIDLQVKTGKAARRDGYVHIDDLFPRPAYVGAGSPEPALVLAVIRQESEFNDQAISHADARGLMQLLPATARNVAARLGLGYSLGSLTLDPGYNVALGRSYLQELIGRFGGAYLLALTSYNAGPHRTDRWLGENGDPRSPATDFVLWVEAIPFAETRNYAMRVLESLVVYRQLLGQSNPAAWGGYNPAGQGAHAGRQKTCCR